MTRPPVFQSTTRRQAPPAIGVAACWDWCAGRIARPFGPPHPPTEKAPPTMGASREAGGPGNSFWQCRNTGALARTRGWPPVLTRYPRGCKAAARFGLVDVPQVRTFFPQVGSFFPDLPFCRLRPVSLSLSLFLEERERREGRRASKRASTGLIFCNPMCPQVGEAIHGFSVDRFGLEIVDWRGFARCWGADPRSTGGNACVPPFFLAWGGVHGSHGMD